MTRKLNSCVVHTESLDADMAAWLKQPTSATEQIDAAEMQSQRDIVLWLTQKAASLNLDYLLAHADDGVIWGKWEQGKLTTSSEHFVMVSPPLRKATLQQARIFGEAAELLVWRDGAGQFHARLITDNSTASGANQRSYFDEPQMLWGDSVEDQKQGFTLWREGVQGLRHAIPCEPLTHKRDDSQVAMPPRLNVRHYLADETKEPAARVAFSRLTGFDLSNPFDQSDSDK